jgi:PKD domain-containing protein
VPGEPDSVPTEAVDPWFTYNHKAPVAKGDGCRTGGSSTSGVAFYDGGLYPDEYDGALFFADASRRCIWVAPRDGTGLPDRAAVRAFVTDASRPVDLTIGPAGDLFYVDLDGGIVHRVQYAAGNRPPVAAIRARPTAGKAPLTVRLDARGSTDPDGDTDLHYAWDLDGDGAFDDGTAARVSHTYAKACTRPGCG